MAKDASQAAAWFAKVAESRSGKTLKSLSKYIAGAQYLLGVLYSTGHGVPKDGSQAARWLRQAAEQGYAPAYGPLASMYYTGEGTPKDERQAFVWFRKAAEAGQAEYQYVLGHMYHEGQGVAVDNIEAYAWLHLAAAAGSKGTKGVAGAMALKNKIERTMNPAQMSAALELRDQLSESVVSSMCKADNRT